MEHLLAQFFEHLRYERNVSEHTLRNYTIDLGQFYDHLAPADPRTGARREVDVKQIDHITIREWLSALHAEKKKKTSIARKLATLRTFFQFLVREEIVGMNPAKLVSTPRLEKKLPIYLSIEDVVRFIETPDTETDLGKRDRAILEFLYGTGMRVSELTKLNLRDVDFRGKQVRVLGKRRKERVVPFGDPALHAVLQYIAVRNAFLQHAPLAERDSEAVFSTIKAHASRRARSGGWSISTSRFAPGCTTSARTRCGIPLPRTCLIAEQTCATFRNCSAMPGYRQRRSTRTFRWRS